jgi:4-azaleucine resistance transporter AzlC
MEAENGTSMYLTGPGVMLGLRLGAPMAVGSVASGIAFGVLARQVGLSGVHATLMSALVVSGGAQFAALPFWRAPVQLQSVIAATLLVNLRYLLQGATLQPWLAGLPRRARYALAFLIYDGNWALAMPRFEGGERELGVFVGAGLALFSAWVAGTLGGYALGTKIGDPRAWALDFVFAAVFVSLLVGSWKGKRDLLPWAVAGAAAAVASRLVPGSWYLLVGTLAGSLTGAARDA